MIGPDGAEVKGDNKTVGPEDRETVGPEDRRDAER
jgi:hypothetical protein